MLYKNIQVKIRYYHKLLNSSLYIYTHTHIYIYTYKYCSNV